jgi:hypothetical protein
MENRRITGKILLEAGRIVEQREADQCVRRVQQALFNDLQPDPLDAAVVIHGLNRALEVPEGRRALGVSAKGRGVAVQYDPSTYRHGSPAVEIALCFTQGKLTRAEARQELAEHTGGNIKTLDRLLDDLCRYFFAWREPD